MRKPPRQQGGYFQDPTSEANRYSIAGQARLG